MGRRLCKPSPTALPSYFLPGGIGVLSASCLEPMALLSGGLQGESASIFEIDWRGFPNWVIGLISEFGGGGWGFVIVGWNPDADGLPSWFEGLKSFDVEGWFRGCGGDGVDGFGEAAGFVGVEAAVTDGLLALGMSQASLELRGASGFYHEQGLRFGQRSRRAGGSFACRIFLNPAAAPNHFPKPRRAVRFCQT